MADDLRQAEDFAATDPDTVFDYYDAGDQARAAGFTESTGLGQDRLTEKGRARANALR